VSRPADLGTPVFALLLAALAASAASAFPLPVGPRTPEGLVAATSFALAAWVAVVVPALPSARPARVLEAACVAAPFLVLGARASASGADLPWPGLMGALAIGTLGASLGGPLRARVATLGACALAAPLVLASAGADAGAGARAFPRPAAPSRAAARSLPGDAVDPRDLVPAPWRAGASRDAGPAPLRVGALARTPPAPEWPAGAPPLADAAYRPVPREADALPAATPVVRVWAPGTSLRRGRVHFAFGTERPAGPLDLDACDAAFLPSDAAGDDASFADALASFARRGGVLIGTAHPEDFSPALARRLGAAGEPGPAGPAGMRPFGLGRVARAAGEADVLPILEAATLRPRWGTAFDRAASPPPAPAAFARWADDPGSRRGGTLLLGAFALAAGAASVLLRGARGVAGVAGLAALAVAGVVATVRAPAGAALEPFVLDLGGAGGRRVEGVFVAAGPGGWVAPPGLASEGGLRALGFEVRRIDGRMRLVLGPGGEGWIVEEALATGVAAGTAPVASPPAWAASLLVEGAEREGDPAVRFAAGTTPYEGPLADGPAAGRRARGVLATPGR
jgi:hypothetical protein